MTEPMDFDPTYMPVGVLTAALQELTPRERRDPDPDLAIEEWLDFAAAIGADCIELSAALHPSVADVPPEAMLDPVANTLDLRDPFNEARAGARSGGRRRDRRRDRRRRLLRRHAPRRSGDPPRKRSTS